MRKLNSVLCVVVMIFSGLVVAGGSAGETAAPRANETCNVPVWNPGDTWNMSINFNPNTQTVSSGITITMTNYQETTSHVTRGTRMFGGHSCYIVSVYSNYSSSGTWDAGGGFSGSISDSGKTVGEQYQRVSDLAYVGADLNMSGSQDMGLGPTAYSVRALSTTDVPTTYFKFPLICSSPNQTWYTASVQTTQVTGTVSETQTNTYKFDSFVEGYESVFVQAGTFDSFRIRNAGTQDRVIGGQPQAQTPYNGNIYYAPDVKHEVKDTNIGMTLTSYYLESPKPDLYIGQSNITLNATPTVGKALTLNGNVTNKVKSGAWMGNATDVIVRFFDGANQIDTDRTYIGNMTPGMTRNFNVTWTPDTAGTHTIRVSADPDGLIGEFDESNNEATLDVNVIEPRPDLFINANDINMTSSPTINIDNRIAINVHNIGSLAATGVSARFYDGAMQIGTDQTIASIPIDGTAVASVMWKPDVLGAHTIRVKMDEFNTIQELSETNNEAAISVSVGQLPYAFTLETQNDALIANPGTGAVYTLELRNVGTKYDTVDFKASTPPNEWTAVLSKNNIAISAGGVESFTLTVTPPLGASAGLQANITVTGTSRGNISMKQSLSTTTTTNRAAGVELTLSTQSANLHGLPGDTKTYTVTLKNTGNDKDTFDLSVDSQKGWISQVVGDKKTTELASGETYSVKVSTTIPTNEPSASKDILTLEAKSRFNASYKETIDVMTTVDQLHDFSVTVTPPEVSVDPGTSARYTIKVVNNGNGREVLMLGLNATPELPSTFTISMDASIDVAAGKDRESTLSIATKDDSVAKTYTLTLDLRPQSGNGTVTKQLTLIVKHVPACSIDALLAYVKTDVGKTVTFTLTIVNDGNGEDTLSLSIVGLTPSWNAMFLDSNSIKLAAKASREITMSVKVPSGASGDTSFTVQVKSGKDSSKTDSVMLTVSAKAKATASNDWLMPVIAASVALAAVVGIAAFALSRRKKDPPAQAVAPVEEITKDVDKPAPKKTSEAKPEEAKPEEPKPEEKAE